MKEKFLTILYEMRRRYRHPFSWFNATKYRMNTQFGLCFCIMETDIDFWTAGPLEILLAILFEEGTKYKATKVNVNMCWWPEGKIKPRLKTINSAIKRIENSNV